MAGLPSNLWESNKHVFSFECLFDRSSWGVFFAICQSLIYNSPRKITYGKRSFDRKRLSRETVSGGCVHTEILCLLRKTGVQRIWNLQFVLELKRVTLCCFNPLPLTRQRDILIERANKCSLHVARLANCECINSCR